MSDEVDSTHRGQPVEAFAHTFEFKPWGEETGGLGTLARSNDDEQGLSLPIRRLDSGTAAANVWGVFL